MNIKRFREALVPLLTTSAGDGAFAALRIATHGMSGVRTAKIINFACRCLEEKEFYLEVGTFSGYSLISAGYQNNTLCIGVDDLSLTEVVKEGSRESVKPHVRGFLHKYLAEYGSPNMQFIESHFRSVVLNEEFKGKLGVLFIDGDHTKADVEETLFKFEPYMCKNAIVIFDDVQYGNIPEFLRDIWGERYELLLYTVFTANDQDMTTHKNMPLDESIANGVCIMVKKEKVNA